MLKEFKATDPRHLSVKEGDQVNGFSQVGDWICGFKDQSHGEFGFAPANYLKLERRTRSGTPTRTTPTNN